MANIQLPPTRGDTAAEISEMFAMHGDSQYGGENVTQLEHALQAAALAQQAGADSALIVAALLHDIGHLLHDLPDDAPERGVDDVHEELGALWLRDRFPTAVLEPVRLHVASKRYLCAVEPGYFDSLSEPSRVSLQLQGGQMSEAQCTAFRNGQHFDAAIKLRRWDDVAKVENLSTPTLSDFLPHVWRVALK